MIGYFGGKNVFFADLLDSIKLMILHLNSYHFQNSTFLLNKLLFLTDFSLKTVKNEFCENGFSN